MTTVASGATDHAPADPVRRVVQDPERLAALRATGLLDAPTEAAFDRLAGLASTLLRTPLATVTLVDAERQFYTACVGLPEPLATARQTPLDVSFCRLTVADAALGTLPADGALAIPDTRLDPRTRDMASVTHFGVLAYAGVPLVVGGQPVGTLCVMDVRPRDWTTEERVVLRELGRSVTTEVELRAANRRLQEQAVELEAQAEELHATTAYLEEQAEAAEGARVAAEAARTRAEHLQSLAAAFAAARTPEAVAHAALAAGTRALGVERGSLYVVADGDGAPTPAGTMLAQVAAVGYDAATAAAWRLIPNAPDTPAGDAVARRTPVVVGRRAELVARYPAMRPLAEQAGYSGTAVFPLIAGAADAAAADAPVLGFLGLDLDAERDFAADEVDFLGALALLAGSALERSQVAATADLERRRLDAVLGALPVGVIVAEAPSGRLVYSNAAVGRIWGHRSATARTEAYSAEWTGYHVDAEGRATARAYESHEWPLARAVMAGEVVADEAVDVARPDGTRVRVGLSAAPVRDADGAVVGGVVVTADVTEAARARDALAAARDAAAAANEAKSQFLANMSHELRTPLNAIGGYVQLVELGIHGPVTDAQREALGRVQRSQHHLLGLINDVLNYAKLEAGKVEYVVEAVDLGEVLAEAAPMVEPQLSAKGLVYDLRMPGAPCAVWADRDKLRQVLLNLLSNAVKFTPAVQEETAPSPGAPGRVTVRVAGGGDAPETCRIEVTDTGVGIPADRLDAVFAPFVQVRAGVGRPAEGTGLGLAISRDLARGMGGDLTAASAFGAGSTFTVTLRRAAPPRA